MAVRMIEDAEKAGKLKPGGTIIEGTSGNTGMGLAIAAVVKGYRCIFTTTDKQSKEKVDALKAFGAEVIVCPTDVDPEDPRSYYSVSSRLEREVPKCLEGQPVRQPLEHRGALRGDGTRDLGADGRQGHAPGVGRGHGRHDYRRRPVPEGDETRRSRSGASTPTGRCSRSTRRPASSTRTRSIPYITEGIGEDFLPKNVDFSVIDSFEKVTDKDAAIMTRRIAREEGIFAGNSAGAAMAGLVQLASNFRQRRHRRRDLPRPRFALPGQDVQRRVDGGARGFLEVSGMTARDLVAMRRVGRALCGGGGAARWRRRSAS